MGVAIGREGLAPNGRRTVVVYDFKGPAITTAGYPINLNSHRQTVAREIIAQRRIFEPNNILVIAWHDLMRPVLMKKGSGIAPR